MDALSRWYLGQQRRGGGRMSTRATRAAVGGDRRALHLPSMDPQAERLGLAQSGAPRVERAGEQRVVNFLHGRKSCSLLRLALAPQQLQLVRSGVRRLHQSAPRVEAARVTRLRQPADCAVDDVTHVTLGRFVVGLCLVKGDRLALPAGEADEQLCRERRGCFSAERRTATDERRTWPFTMRALADVIICRIRASRCASSSSMAFSLAIYRCHSPTAAASLMLHIFRSACGARRRVEWVNARRRGALPRARTHLLGEQRHLLQADALVYLLNLHVRDRCAHRRERPGQWEFLQPRA